MKVLIVLAALVASVAAVSLRENIEPLTVEHVEYINSLNTTWKAQHNFRGLTIKDLKKLCGTFLEFETDDIATKKHLTNFRATIQKGLPDNFDAREKWPECAETINHVRDQGSCGSCWAVAAAGAITDRVCIASGGKKKTPLSEQILSCCTDCFETELCQGGYPIQAYLYWLREGLVTGGDYGSKQGCLPYEVAPCEHHVDGPRPKCGEIVPSPKCSTTCSNKAIDFTADKSYGKLAFRSGRSVGEIKTELMKRGPMTASFVVYDDFFLYKDGIYTVTPGAEKVGGHAVQVYGWGTAEDGTEYWKAKNSWNTDWGNKGFFNIEVRAAGINQGFSSGIPKPEPAPKYDDDEEESII